MNRNAEISGNSGSNDSFKNSSFMKMGTKILLSAIISGFIVIAFILFVHLYANWYSNRRANNHSFGGRRSRRRRFDFAPTGDPVSLMHRGLEPSTLQALPVVIFRSHEFKDGLQCAVCLSDLLEGEKARLLPRCNHGFHVDCIDMWFKSHKTCPLCRSPVSPESLELKDQSETHEENYSIDSSVLGFESQNHESHEELGTTVGSGPGEAAWPTSSRTALAIEIPTRSGEEIPPPISGSASGSAGDEEFKSPKTPRFRTLMRLLSRGRRDSTPRSPHLVDVERGQGERDQCSLPAL